MSTPEKPSMLDGRKLGRPQIVAKHDVDGNIIEREDFGLFVLTLIESVEDPKVKERDPELEKIILPDWPKGETFEDFSKKPEILDAYFAINHIPEAERSSYKVVDDDENEPISQMKNDEDFSLLVKMGGFDIDDDDDEDDDDEDDEE